MSNLGCSLTTEMGESGSKPECKCGFVCVEWREGASGVRLL